MVRVRSEAEKYLADGERQFGQSQPGMARGGQTTRDSPPSCGTRCPAIAKAPRAGPRHLSLMRHSHRTQVVRLPPP